MSILALDLGTQMGYAIQEDDGRVFHGSVSFSPKTMGGDGHRFLAFWSWLKAKHEKHPSIELVVYEKVRNHTATDAAHIYGAFEGFLQAYCAQNRMRLEGYGVGTIKKATTGAGNASKHLMIQAMKAKGYNPVDDNAADALSILLIVAKPLDPKA